jgi:hypothetical protein
MNNYIKSNFSVSTLQNIQAEVDEMLTNEFNRLRDEISKNSKLSKEEKNLQIQQLKVSEEFKNKAYSKILDYVYSYYFETSKGDYFCYDYIKDEFSHRTQKDFINEVCNKLYKNSFETLFMKNPKIYALSSRLDKPRIYTENGVFYINECKGFLHKTYLPFQEYSDEIKAKVQLMLDCIKEISCNNNENLYLQYEKYIAQLCRGIKTEVIMYRKSKEGIGKSTETDFLMKHVLGEGVCLLSGTEPLTSNNNKIFLGKLLIVFEELPVFGMREWEAVSSKLKTLTTEKTAMYRGLFKDPFQAENISNFMINTNVESIKNSSGRRYIILPCSESRIGDFNYFENIKTNCYNNEVGEAFYSYMMEINIDGFYAQKSFPDTENKLLAIASQLDPLEKFLKFNYVLKNKAVSKVKTTDFYSFYVAFCSQNNYKHLTNTMFYARLKTHKIEKGPKNNGYYYYDVSLEDLKKLASKHKWICEFDEEIDERVDDDEDDDDDQKTSPLDAGLPKSIDYKALYERSQKEIERLKQLLKK